MPAANGAFVSLAHLLLEGAGLGPVRRTANSSGSAGLDHGLSEPPKPSAPATPPSDIAAGVGRGAEAIARPVEDGRFSALTQEARSGSALGRSAHGRSAAARACFADESCAAAECQVGAARDARLFSAALADACDQRLGRLLETLAADVLGRELLLARADVGALAQRLIAEHAGEMPIRLRVADSDAEIACALPVVVDAALEPGDAILECRTGDIDARLAIRLAAAVRAQVQR